MSLQRLFPWLAFSIAIGSSSLLTNDVLGDEVTLKELHCTKTEDWLGDGDEAAIYVYVDGNFFNLYTRTMKKGETWSIDEVFRFSNNVVVKLYDLDNPEFGDSNDFLGDIKITKNTTSSNGLFELDDAIYKLTWEKKASNNTPNTQPGGDIPPDVTPSPLPGPSPQKANEMKAVLEKFLTKHLAKGNEGKARITKFEYDNGAIKFGVDIKHRHKTSGVILYSFDTNFEGVFDPRNPQSIKKTRVCTKLNAYLGGNEICVTLEQIAAALAL